MMKSLTVLVMLLLASIVNTGSHQPKIKEIQVDCSAKTGEIRSLQGINCGPTGARKGVDVIRSLSRCRYNDGENT
jgi:hypothetical protein